MQGVEDLLLKICDVVWGPWLVVLLFGTHIYLTFRLRFIQRYLGKAIKLSMEHDGHGKGDISHFAALTVALAATIGTGNIVGVSTAIAFGGPGAVFWMWLTGVFGMATKYAEALLSIKYRIINKAGEMAGGPMYVLEKALGLKWLGVLFAVFTAIAAFGIGNMVQSNSIAVLAKDTFGIDPWVSGIVLAILTAIVILGGIKSIAKVCAWLVPFMAMFYILGCLALLVINHATLPHAFILIITSAFNGHAVAGGFIGAGAAQAMRYGIARGLFSNESGLGSAPIIAAAAKTRNPIEQALVSSSGTFWDTVVVCAMTGLVVVNSGEWINGLNGALLTKAAFADIPLIGPFILTIALLTFVFSTLIGWSYYGEKALEYLLGTWSILPYRWLWILGVLVGSVSTLTAVWTFADIANALMALPNLVALLLLSNVLVSETKKYLWDEGK